MSENNRALGLIEVIGYPTAIAAADAALKASNVHLSTISKVGSGIMTVQLLGDVSAIRSAVDAGGAEARQIGTLRYTHVIPRYDTALAGSLIKPAGAPAKTPAEPEPPAQTPAAQTIPFSPTGALTETDLRARSNAELKSLIAAMEIDADERFLRTAKKEELITTIMEHSRKEAEHGLNG